MIVLNFSHPLTEEQKAQIESLTGNTTSEVRTIPVQIEQGEPLGPQIVALADASRPLFGGMAKTSLVITPPDSHMPPVCSLQSFMGAWGASHPSYALRPVTRQSPPMESARSSTCKTFGRRHGKNADL